jgi:hypothetical protein
VSIMIDTPDGIAFARLAALKGALDLQSKGLRLSRNFSATQIAKQQYGLKGQASTMHQHVAAIVGDHFMVRESDLAEEAALVLLRAVNAINDAGRKVTESSINGQIARDMNGADPGIVKVAEAIGRIYLFEQGTIPAARVLFRG